MKTAGLIIIVICFSLSGFAATARLSGRVKTLELGRYTIQKLRRELMLTKASSLRILQQTARKSGQTLPLVQHCILLCSEKPFPEAWRQAVEETLGDLSGEEKDLFCRVGAILGSSDLKHQEEALLQCEADLDSLLKAEKEKLRTHGRLYNSLGILTGLMAAVILV